jgi:AcrR family transcriptional regulator
VIAWQVLNGVESLKLPRVLTSEAVDEFRERLVDAAERLFAQHGLEAVTMRQLAAELGVSPMTPYRYFADKEAILAAVRARAFNRHAEALERALEQGDTPLERANAVGRAYLDFALGHPEAYKLMFDIKQANEAAHPELVQAGARSRATMTAHLTAMIEGGVVKGDPELIGHMFWSALHGAIQLQLAGMLSQPYDAERLAGAIMQTLWLGLNAEPV